jgi:hypothetical protein
VAETPQGPKLAKMALSPGSSINFSTPPTIMIHHYTRLLVANRFPAQTQLPQYTSGFDHLRKTAVKYLAVTVGHQAKLSPLLLKLF